MRNDVQLQQDDIPDFTQRLQYVNDVDVVLGVDGDINRPIRIATKFNSGREGINVSHAGCWFRVEDMVQGMFRVEIRGGSVFENSTLLTRRDINYNLDDIERHPVLGIPYDEDGMVWNILLNDTIAFAPNQDFWVVFHLPPGIQAPFWAGPTERVVRRFLIEYPLGSGQYLDFQDATGQSRRGYYMYAAETVPRDMSWIRLTSAESGTLSLGQSTNVNLTIFGDNAFRGSQHANVVVKSNDTRNSEVRVPVTLRINDGPVFMDIPEMPVMFENSELTIQFKVVDVEGHEFEIRLIQTNHILQSWSWQDSMVTMTFRTAYGDAGIHEFIFRGVDELGISTQPTIRLEVRKVHRPPYFSGESVMSYPVLDEFIHHHITDFFTHPDGDDLAYTIKVGNPNIVELFTSGNSQWFAVRPIQNGETTYEMTATHSPGGSASATVKVISGTGTSIQNRVDDPHPIRISLRDDQLTIHLAETWRNDRVEVELIDLSGRVAHRIAANAVESLEMTTDIQSLPTGMYIVVVKSDTKSAQSKIVK